MTPSPAPRTGMSARRRALFRELLARDGLSTGSAGRIDAHGERGPVPLSHFQRQLWAFEQAFPGTAAYVIPILVRVTGNLDRGALARALDSVLARHSTLRSHIVPGADEPAMRISPHAPRPLPVHEPEEVDAAERERAGEERVRRDAARPFDLTSGPLVRYELIRVTETEHLFWLAMHHIVGDAWSADVLLREIAESYQAALQGRPPEAEPLSIQYGDFARWQREAVAGERFAGHAEFWKDRLADPPAVLELATDRPRPARPGFRGGIVGFEVPGGVLRSVRRLCREEAATPYMMALAVFNVLLHRYTGREDIVVGSTMANRSHAQTTPLVGFFVNILPVRTRVPAARTFRELLRCVRAEVTEVLAHQDLPLERLVAELNPPRTPTGSPFFDIVFAYRSAARRLSMPGLDVVPLPVHNGTAKRTLTLQMVEGEQQAEGLFEYDRDLFDAATVSRMAGHYGCLLESAAADPDTPVSELRLLTREEERSLHARNRTAMEIAPELRCVHKVFEAQAARTPEAPAVRCDGETLSYAELDRRAGQLASLLAESGVTAEVTVGACFANSPQMVVAVLGILKAGGAYVPVDPADPEKRRRAVLADAGATVVVQGPGVNWAGDDLCRVELDPSFSVLGDRPSAPRLAGPAPENMAYLLYTSGSTGVPKGVAVEHRQLANYTFAIMRRLSIEEPLRYAMQQPLTVDSAVTMLFPPLCTGGELHLIPRERTLDAGWIAEYNRSNAIDCLKIAPSHLRALQRAPGFPGVLPRRHLIVGGEASESGWMADLRQRAGKCAVYNHYGPTETTVGVAVLTADDALGQGSGAVPIGPPIANTRLYVVDRTWQPVPAGVPGELCVGGANVVRGYHRRAALTAGAFVPDPFGEPGGRLYRTGDMVRQRPDGSLEFLGRRDDQVKIRGFRVELPEIDKVLVDHPGVRDGLVTVRTDATGERRVIAYAVARDARDFDADQIMDFLRSRLPSYMVPAALVRLDALPLSRHGKLDRGALPAPPEPDQTAGPPGRANPAGSLVDLIGSVWRRLLGVGEIDVGRNFFDAGGHSLLALRLHEELQSMLGMEFDPIELFQHTTVQAQADFLAGQPGGTDFERAKDRGRGQSEVLRRRQRAHRRGGGGLD
ncbi:amino acid adenylation domain-containing protein [Actinomadura chokoriensis]|uniref:Amino acid adenylation domain-containing protein n=1 Tax=Actinomadura chokoriensis TaxID=454156 RepID=A0ABV4QYT3_9ACTN